MVFVKVEPELKSEFRIQENSDHQEVAEPPDSLCEIQEENIIQSINIASPSELVTVNIDDFLAQTETETIEDVLSRIEFTTPLQLPVIETRNESSIESPSAPTEVLQNVRFEKIPRIKKEVQPILPINSESEPPEAADSFFPIKKKYKPKMGEYYVCPSCRGKYVSSDCVTEHLVGCTGDLCDSSGSDGNGDNNETNVTFDPLELENAAAPTATQNRRAPFKSKKKARFKTFPKRPKLVNRFCPTPVSVSTRLSPSEPKVTLVFESSITSSMPNENNAFNHMNCCPVCFKSFKSKIDVENHRVGSLCHPEDQPEQTNTNSDPPVEILFEVESANCEKDKYCCVKCCTLFSSISILAKHSANCSRPDMDHDYISWKHPCFLCRRSFASGAENAEHCHTVHGLRRNLCFIASVGKLKHKSS